MGLWEEIPISGSPVYSCSLKEKAIKRPFLYSTATLAICELPIGGTHLLEAVFVKMFLLLNLTTFN